MYYRKHGHQTDISFQTEHQNELGLISTLCIPTPLPDAEIMTSEMRHWIHQAILKLNPDYQTVIALRFFEEKKIKEISMITGRREGTVRSQLHRGMEQLKALLANHKVDALNEVMNNE
jgi:RNA polymerase sigma-70 factor (ECF subfamily)